MYGSITKEKYFIVGKGYVQKDELDYKEIFSLFIYKLETVISMIALSPHFGLIVYQMDVKSTFLNGDFEEVYMNQNKNSYL